MNNPATPEFSRLIRLDRLGADPYRQRIEADRQERERLAQRFDLVRLDFFAAEVELRRQNGATILLDAAFHAEFEQCCAATLEPVRGAISDRFSLIYGPAKAEEQDITLSENEPAFEPLDGEAIDIAEAVAQELSLALPEFPRDPNAAIDELLPAEPIEGPFSALARLRKRSEC